MTTNLEQELEDQKNCKKLTESALDDINGGIRAEHNTPNMNTNRTFSSSSQHQNNSNSYQGEVSLQSGTMVETANQAMNELNNILENLHRQVDVAKNN